MTPVCPFVKAARPDDASLKRSGDNQSRHTAEHGSKSRIESVNSAGIEPKCPFGYDSQSSVNKSGCTAEHESGGKTESINSAKVEPKCPFGHNSQSSENKSGCTAEHASEGKTESINSAKIEPKCPFGYDSQSSENKSGCTAEHESEGKTESTNSAKIEPKCPFGYDSQSFKLGPLSCMICQALLFESSRCVPCSHVYCRRCISRFKDCPLCGADIEKIEDDEDLQKVVDGFIDGHARMKRSQASTDAKEAVSESKHVIYEDVSLERGAFLVQQAMRAFRVQNFESAKSRLTLCAADIREQLDESVNKPDMCSQLGAVLGTLGDCCRAMGDAGSAVTYFEESVELLSRFPIDDIEIAHTLSVSLNKIGDLKYYVGDLQAARSYYSRSLDVRRGAMKSHCQSPSLILDVAVSLAKVADVNRGLENENGALTGFHEAINLLESLKIGSDESPVEQRRQSVLEFLNSQIAEKQPDETN